MRLRDATSAVKSEAEKESVCKKKLRTDDIQKRAIMIDRKKKWSIEMVYTCLSLGALLLPLLLLLIAKDLLQLPQEAMPLFPLLLTREP